MASKISVGSVRQSIATILEQSTGEQKRNFVETVRFPSPPPRSPSPLARGRTAVCGRGHEMGCLC